MRFLKWFSERDMSMLHVMGGYMVGYYLNEGRWLAAIVALVVSIFVIVLVDDICEATEKE